MTEVRPVALRQLLGVPFTDEQLAAATAPLAPSLVVAGAGSGKTAVMAARVVWLVVTGQVAADAVLGLTFTNKAAAELAERVRRALDAAGVDAQAEPTVLTYHAYAGRLLVEHGLRIGAEPGARLLADATRYVLARRAVRTDPGPFRYLTSPMTMVVDAVVDLDGELAEHLVGTAELTAHDATLLDRLVAEPATAELRQVTDCLRKRLELTRLVDAYRAEKRAQDSVDFGDQMASAARLAEECGEVAAAERAKFGVVLLDEYQDTSVAQRRMLVGLFGAGHPVTAVGDPCQAIYGWRGASVANLADFPMHFPRADGTPARSYQLGENRRSGGRLLALANRLAEPLRAAHPDVPTLRPTEDRTDDGAVVCALLPSFAEEMAWVADQLGAAVDAGTRPGQCAVLLRARSDFAAAHDALVARGLPVEVVGLSGLLAMPEVADVVAVLQLLDDPTANTALVRLATGPRWRIGPRDLAELGRRAAALSSRSRGAELDVGEEADDALERAVSGSDPVDVTALADALDDPGPGCSDEGRRRLRALGAELRELRRALNLPLLDLLQRVISQTGLDVEVAASRMAQRAGQRESLATFLDYAAGFLDFDAEASLGAFLAFLRAAEEHERGLDAAGPSGRDAVQVLTMHKAKGLEWDVVAVPNLSATVFPGARVQDRWTTMYTRLPFPLRGDAAGLPAVDEWTSAGLTAFRDRCAERLALDERRLGYVAVTRARHRLVASGHWWGPTQVRRRGPSSFLLEIRDYCAAGGGVVAQWADEPEPAAVNPMLAAAQELRWPAPPDAETWRRRRAAAALVRERIEAGPAPDPALGDAELEQVAAWDVDLDVLLTEVREARRGRQEVPVPAVLSASQLVRLAADPDGLARELARPMPRRPVPAARRGTRFHAWVEAHYGARPLLEPEELPGAADEAPADTGLDELRAGFLAGPYANREPVAVEAAFQLVLGGRVVAGRIDAVFATDDGFEVVDWKTGQEPADPMQLAVYRLAWARLAGVPVQRVQAAFCYLPSGRVDRPERLADEAELHALLGG